MRAGVAVWMCVLLGCGDDGASTPDAAVPLKPATKRVFLAFDGVTVMPGAVTNAAANIDANLTATATYPAFLANHPEREAILDGIVSRAQAKLAPYDLDVVRARPADRYMMIVFTDNGKNHGQPENSGGLGGVQCGVSPYSQTISIAFEQDVVISRPAEDIAAWYAFFVASLGPIGHGVPQVRTVPSCLCWAHPDCTFDPSTVDCTMDGTVTLDPDWQCPGAPATFDLAAELTAKLGPRP